MNKAKARLQRIFVDLIGPKSVGTEEGKRYACSELSKRIILILFFALKQNIPRTLEASLAATIKEGDVKMIRSNDDPDFHSKLFFVCYRHRVKREYKPLGVRVLFLSLMTESLPTGPAVLGSIVVQCGVADHTAKKNLNGDGFHFIRAEGTEEDNHDGIDDDDEYDSMDRLSVDANFDDTESVFSNTGEEA